MFQIYFIHNRRYNALHIFVSIQIYKVVIIIGDIFHVAILGIDCKLNIHVVVYVEAIVKPHKTKTTARAGTEE